MKKMMVLCVGAVLLTTSTSFAKWYPDKSAGVQVNIPGHWKVGGGGDTLEAESKDGMAMLHFMVMDGNTVDAALDEMEKQLGTLFRNVKPDGDPSEFTHGPFRGIEFTGVGMAEGVRFKFAVMLFQRPGKRVVMMYGLVVESKWGKHKRTIHKILKSISSY